VFFNAQAIRAGASIGVAVGLADGDDADALYKSADLALYQAKREGRSTWRWHGQTASTEPSSLFEA